MRRSIKPITLTLCIMALAINVMAETEFDYLQVAEDIDIMAKIMDKALEEEFPDEYRSSTLFRESRGCQGIYLKGYGAVFITSIGFPVAEREAPEEEATSDDLWQQTKYELKGASTTPAIRRGDEGYDPEEVGRLKERLLEAIGDYGSNIRQLGYGENIVIAVRGRSELGRVAISPVRVEIKGLQENLQKEIREQMKSVEKLQKELQEDLQKQQGLQGDLQKQLKEQMKNVEKSQKELQKQLKGMEGPSSWIPYKLEEPAEVIIQISDVGGKPVRTLELGLQEPGDYTDEGKAAHWDGKNDAGDKVAPGLYVYTVKAGDLTSTGKLMLMEQPEPGATEPSVPPVVVSPGAHVMVPHPERRVTVANVPEPVVVASTGQSPEESAEVWVGTKDAPHTRAIVAHYGAQFESSVSGRTTLIIRVSKENIAGYKSGTLGFDEFAEQAEITQY